MKNVIFLGLTLTLSTLILGAGCGKAGTVDKNNWSAPQVLSQSRDSLDSSFSLQKWNDTLLALNARDSLIAVYFLEDEKSWREQKTDSPNSWLPLDCDPKSNRFIISRGTMSNDEMRVFFCAGSIAPGGKLLISKENRMSETVATFFERLSPGVTFPGGTAVFARGALAEANVCIPYSVRGDNSSGRFDDGPFTAGVFFSSDSGATWHKKRICDFYTVASSVRITKGHIYFFLARAQQGVLCFSRRPMDSDTWSPPEAITKTFGTSGFIRRFITVAEDDNMHVCWLDRRHEKKGLNPIYADSGNYEVAYCHRSDADDAWSKDVILSDGLMYAYSPSMSVEGDKVVVVWAGVRDDSYGRNEWNPSDIYYVTSKDGGKTWAKAMQVTDGFKNGITSGRPQVALLKNIIHLFYIQGKVNYREVSSGAAKLNQPPWPIFYTQRRFPN